MDPLGEWTAADIGEDEETDDDEEAESDEKDKSPTSSPTGPPSFSSSNG